MFSTGELLLDADVDLAFLFSKVDGFRGHGIVTNQDGKITVQIDGRDFAAVSAAAEAYPSLYLEVALPAKLAAISAERDRRIKSFTFGGFSLDLEGDAKRDLADAAFGMTRNPDVAGIDWSLGAGAFLFLSRDMLLALADAAFLHIQLTFAGHRRLADAAKAAANIAALAAVDERADASWSEPAGGV